MKKRKKQCDYCKAHNKACDGIAALNGCLTQARKMKGIFCKEEIAARQAELNIAESLILGIYYCTCDLEEQGK